MKSAIGIGGSTSLLQENTVNYCFSPRGGWILATVLACTTAMYCTAQQPASTPVPVTNDTPAATSRPMPPETTPVQGTGAAAGTPMTKDQLKSQRKQQRAEEKAANSNAKAAKSSAKAKKQADKAVQDQEKATPAPTRNPQ